MNLRDLHYLVAVAEHKHFGRAAQSCFVSQPTLSAQLKKLEEYLGVQLVERTQRHVMITNTGEAVVDRAKSVLQEVKLIQEIAQQAKDPQKASLKVGIVTHLACYFLPLISSTIKQNFPDLELDFYESNDDAIAKQLKEGQLDAIIAPNGVKNDRLQSKEILLEPLKIVVNRTNAIAHQTLTSLSQLQGQKILLLNENNGLSSQIKSLFKMSDIDVTFKNCGNSFETLVQMATLDDGITLLPAMAADKYKNQNVVIKDFPGLDASRSIGLIWRKCSAKSPFLDNIADVILTLSEQPVVADEPVLGVDS